MSDLGSGPPVAAGRLADLAPLEATVVCTLRLFYAGVDTRDALATALARHAGPERGTSLMARFGELCELTRRHSRRPLARRHPGCCLAGTDETAFAAMVAAAAQGEREDALLIAVCLVRPDVAPALISLAGQVGLDLLRLTAPVPSSRHGLH
jgi:hypothetical protein